MGVRLTSGLINDVQESIIPNPQALESTGPIPYNNMRNSPVTPINSNSGSAHSDLSGSAVHSEEINSGEAQAIYSGSGLYPVNEHVQTQNNNFDWGDLEEPYIGVGSHTEGQHLQYELLNSPNNGSFLSSQGVTSSEHSSEVINNSGFDGVKQGNNRNFQTVVEHNSQSPFFDYFNPPPPQVIDLKSTLDGSSEMPRLIADEILTSQDSFGRWNYVNNESLQSLDSVQFDASIAGGDKSDAFQPMDQFCMQVPIFNIVDVSPQWAYSSAETKVLVVGHFNEPYKHLSGSKVFCVFGETSIAAEMVQNGVYRCTTSSAVPGLVKFFLTLDGRTPISQILGFEHRPLPSLQSSGVLNSMEKDSDKSNKSLSQVQIRLCHLLFSTSNNISILSNKIQPKSLKEAKKYDLLSSPLLENDWLSLLKLREDNEISDDQDLFELFLKNKLHEWLLLKLAEGCKITPLDSQGQGAIHLCAILDYAWAVRLFSLSGFSLDFRDASGWTALHWAASYGREKTVAALLTAGANASLVTDPTPANPGGCTAADLASKEGYEGLAAYLAEKALTAHVLAMSRSGNITASPPPTSHNVLNSDYSENLSEQELCLKESLAAYRNAADAADRIQAAFRERSLKQQTKAVQLANPVLDAAQIVAALKIQHAFRNYSRRRLMKAAAHIQSYFRTWQARKNFLNMRRQAIKIQ
ncbi:uncharacterized protein A4U43_C07F13110, partial [Asparagus officinalis]